MFCVEILAVLLQYDLQRQLDDMKQRSERDRRESTQQADSSKARATQLAAEVCRRQCFLQQLSVIVFLATADLCISCSQSCGQSLLS